MNSHFKKCRKWTCVTSRNIIANHLLKAKLNALSKYSSSSYFDVFQKVGSWLGEETVDIIMDELENSEIILQKIQD